MFRPTYVAFLGAAFVNGRTSSGVTACTYPDVDGIGDREVHEDFAWHGVVWIASMAEVEASVWSGV